MIRLLLLIACAVTGLAAENRTVEVGGTVGITVPVLGNSGAATVEIVNLRVAGPGDYAAGDCRCSLLRGALAISMAFPARQGGAIPVQLEHGAVITLQVSPAQGGPSHYRITVTGSTGGGGGGGGREPLSPAALDAAGPSGVFLESLRSVSDPSDPDLRSQYLPARITDAIRVLSPAQVTQENAAAMAAQAINWYTGHRAVIGSVFGPLGRQAEPNRISVPNDGFGNCMPRSKQALVINAVAGVLFYSQGILWTPGYASSGGRREDQLGWYGSSLSMAAAHALARSYALSDARVALVAAGQTAVGRSTDVELQYHPLLMAVLGNTPKATEGWARSALHQAFQGYKKSLGSVDDLVEEARTYLDDGLSDLLMVGSDGKGQPLRVPNLEIERGWRRVLLFALANLERDLADLGQEAGIYAQLTQESAGASPRGSEPTSFPDACRMASVDDTTFLLAQARWALLPDVTPPNPPTVPELALPSLRVRSDLLAIQWIMQVFALAYPGEPGSWPRREVVGTDRLPDSAVRYADNGRAFLTLLAGRRTQIMDALAAALQVLRPESGPADPAAVSDLGRDPSFWRTLQQDISRQPWEETLVELVRRRFVTVDSPGGTDTTASKDKPEPKDRYTVLPRVWAETIAGALDKIRKGCTTWASIFDRQNQAARAGLDERCALLAMAVGQSLDEPYGLELFQPELRRDRLAWFRTTSLLSFMTRLDAKAMIEHTRETTTVTLTPVLELGTGCDYRDTQKVVQQARTVLVGMLTLEADIQLLAASSARMLTLLDRDMLYQSVRVQRKSCDLITRSLDAGARATR